MIERRRILKLAASLIPAGAGLPGALARAAVLDGAGPLAPRPGHFPAKATNLVAVFLTGGFSHVDTFDFKPVLMRDSGKIVPSVDLRGSSNQPLLGFPVHEGRTGLVIAGGLNPVAAVEEAGIETENFALSQLFEFERLTHYSEMALELGIQPGWR